MVQAKALKELVSDPLDLPKWSTYLTNDFNRKKNNGWTQRLDLLRVTSGAGSFSASQGLDFKDNRPKDIADLFHDPCKKTIEDSTVTWLQPLHLPPSAPVWGTGYLDEPRCAEVTPGSGTHPRVIRMISKAKNRIVEHFQDRKWTK